MRRITTGEGVDLNEVKASLDRLAAKDRRYEASVHDDQVLVEDLMQLTPTSSDEENEFRDGYVLAPPEPERQPARTPKPDPFGGSESTDAAPLAAPVFSKVQVPEIQAQSSLLSSSLAARVGNRHRRSLSASDAAKALEAATKTDGAEPAAPTTAQWHSTQTVASCTVYEFIRAVVRVYSAMEPGYALPTEDPRGYELRVLENGVPDFDFPELDPSAKLEDFGESEFGLCVRDACQVVLQIRTEKGRATSGTAILRILLRRNPNVPTLERQRSASSGDVAGLLGLDLPQGAGQRKQTSQPGSRSGSPLVPDGLAAVAAPNMGGSAIRRPRRRSASRESPVNAFHNPAPVTAVSEPEDSDEHEHEDDGDGEAEDDEDHEVARDDTRPVVDTAQQQHSSSGGSRGGTPSAGGPGGGGLFGAPSDSDSEDETELRAAGRSSRPPRAPRTRAAGSPRDTAIRGVAGSPVVARRHVQITDDKQQQKAWWKFWDS